MATILRETCQDEQNLLFHYLPELEKHKVGVAKQEDHDPTTLRTLEL